MHMAHNFDFYECYLEISFETIERKLRKVPTGGGRISLDKQRATNNKHRKMQKR